jgi:hypothetical protein
MCLQAITNRQTALTTPLPVYKQIVALKKEGLPFKASFGLKEILEEKKNELSPHSKIPPFFLQNSFNPKEP